MPDSMGTLVSSPFLYKEPTGTRGESLRGEVCARREFPNNFNLAHQRASLRLGSPLNPLCINRVPDRKYGG